MPVRIPLQFTSFRARLISYLVLLLLLVLVTVFVSVNRSTYNNTRAVIDNSLRVSRVVFSELLLERERNFKEAFRAMALDYAFRTAYSNTDYETMLTVGENLLERTDNADMLMIVDYDYLMVADTLRLHPPEADFPWPELLEAAEDSEGYETTSFVLIRNIAYHVIAVPILTPLVDGWIIVGQRLDDGFVESIKRITTSEVSIIMVDGGDSARTLATTLPDNQGSLLQTNLGGESTLQDQTRVLDLGGEEFVSLTRPLLVSDNLTLVAMIQQSLPRALAPYRNLEQQLIVFFSLGVILSLALAMFLGRSVSRPVMGLVNRVRKIEAGDFTTASTSERKDEIGLLENSVNNMARGMAEKEKVRDLLGKVVSKEIAEELMGGQVKLGGETRIATILFSDIRDFTNLCEGRQPEEILEMLNHYLSAVSTVIENHKGVVDKYIGDAVMALFGAPVRSDDDVDNALNGALDMLIKVEQLNVVNKQAGFPLLTTGIGLHTGEVVAGNLGSANRMNYTVIGDAVNLASRLEALTKQYGVSIMVSEDTRNAGGGFVYRELDMVRVKGKDRPVRIFEMVGKQGQVSQTMLENIATFESALADYRRQHWDKAEAVFTLLAGKQPDSKLLKLFLQRIETCRASPPGDDWDGVFTFDTK